MEFNPELVVVSDIKKAEELKSKVSVLVLFGEDNIVKAEHINAPKKVVNIINKIVMAYNKYYDIESYNQTSFMHVGKPGIYITQDPVRNRTHTLLTKIDTYD